MKILPIFRKKENVDKKITDIIYQYLSKSRSKTDRYKRAYRNLILHLNNFSEQTGLLINTDSFTEPASEEFIAYLKSRNLMLTTITSIFAMLGTSLRRAKKEGYKVDFGFEQIRIKEEDSCAVYLTVEELKRINSLKNLSKEAKECRDRFLVGCFTALRISDYRRLSVEINFSGNFIYIKTQKTGEPVIIPIHPIIRDVLKRNNNIIPTMKSQQAFGATIKRICKRAGITEPILWERTIGNKIVRKRLHKYQLVSSHTARRSGATNMYLAGIPVARIMLLTGHKTEQAFFKYIRINKKENAKVLSEHDFFN